MSEFCREQHPLLAEEASVDEPYSPQYFRRRPMTARRAKNNLKGAAAVIARWPEHWGSFLTYWWIGLGMISITTFIIYNSMFAFTVLPAAALKPSKLFITEGIKKTSPPILTNAFMHVFVHQNTEKDLKEYMPHIESFSRKHSNFKYHLVLVINDTNVNWLGDEENNEIALNKLWTKDDNSSSDREKSKIHVQYITLSAYMDNSPLIKYWRLLPPQFLEFLARAVSVWDRGGIAFNPNILTDMSQRSIYLDKLNNLFQHYSKPTNKIHKEVDGRPEKVANRVKGDRKFNNIRDIINALDKDDESTNPFAKQNLLEAEDIMLPSVITPDRDILSTTQLSKVKLHEKKNLYQISLMSESFNSTRKNLLNDSSMKESDVSQNTTDKTKTGLLPLFLDYLFHNKANTVEETKTRKRKNAINLPTHERSKVYSPIHTTNKLVNSKKEILRPVIVTAPETFNTDEQKIPAPQLVSNELNKTSELNQLTIDLKGNIIATDTACHAFLGTIFTNAVHHGETEKVTDFIISELTTFCKGVLSSCKGIELILL